MAAQVIGWEKVQKAEAGEEDIKDLSSDSRTVELINEAKSPENIVGDEKENEKKEDTDNAVKHEDDKLRCHDSSGSNTDSNSKSGSGNDSDKSHKSGSRLEGDKNISKKVHRKNLKKRPLKGKLAKKAREPKVQGTLEISPEDRLECHSSDSKSNSGDDSSGSKSGSKSDSKSDSGSKSDSKSDSGSKSDSSTKSNSGLKSDSSTKSNSGSNSGGKKNKVKKESLELKKEESSIEQNKVADQNKLTEAEQGIEATSGDNNGNTATIKEKKKGILGKIMEKLPVYGKNVVEESTEKATKDN